MRLVTLLGFVLCALSPWNADAYSFKGLASMGASILPDSRLRHHSRQLLQTGSCVNVAYTNFGGDVLADGAANLQPSAGACCNSCWSQARQAIGGKGCNAWVWCGMTSGCDNGFGTVYGYQQCTLKFQASLQALQPSFTQASKMGASNFTSGWIPTYSQMADQTPPVTGYSRYPGVDFQNAYDYSCPNSLSTGFYCQRSGTVTAVAASCTSDPNCKAFVYVPNQSTGFLKGPAEVDLSTLQDLAFATPNPNAVSYVKVFAS